MKCSFNILSIEPENWNSNNKAKRKAKEIILKKKKRKKRNKVLPSGIIQNIFATETVNPGCLGKESALWVENAIPRIK